MKEETSYPPRCCRQPFPIDQVKHHLAEIFCQAFLEKGEELEYKNKLYCHVATCSAYIGKTRRSHGAKVGACPRAECAQWTCLTCKGPHHTGKCPDDEGTELVLEIAKKEGWQRCKPCGRMLELTVGCYHMTCICRAQFCYKCAAPWMTCKCPQWEEARLLAQANEIARRQVPNPVNVQAVAAQLRATHHNCATDGHECRRQRYPNQDCAGCDYRLRFWINECTHCQVQLCNWCRDRE